MENNDSGEEVTAFRPFQHIHTFLVNDFKPVLVILTLMINHTSLGTVKLLEIVTMVKIKTPCVWN